MQRFLNNWSVLCTATEAHFGKGTKGDTALPTLPNPHYPSKIANTLALLCTITLASLVKGRWIDGKAQTVALLRLLAAYPPFLCYKLFCRQDGGIVILILAPHQPFQNRTITIAFRRASVCVCLYGFAFELSHLAFRRGVGLPLPLHLILSFPQPL